MVHIGKAIEEELRTQERTISWFARRLDCDRTKIYQIFHKEAIKTDILMQISLILNKDFFKMLQEEFKLQQRIIKK